MARIRFYPEDNRLHPSDHIVGTDEVSGNGATRVFTVQALTDYLTSFLNITPPATLADGFIPVSDGSGGYNESTILIKDVDTTGTLEFTGITGNKVKLFTTSTGFGRLSIAQDVPGGFNIDPSTLVGLEFTAVGSFGTITETIFATQNSPNVGEFWFSLLNPIDSQIPADPAFLSVTSISFPDASSPFSTKVTCIGGDTINVGNLEVGGNLIVDGQPVDLSQINQNRDDIITIQDDISDLESSKADASDLHPAATLPDPTPAASGVASTAVVSIEIDPATQVMSVVRGTVPVVIGGTGMSTGGDISVQGFTVDDVTLGNSTEISWIPATSGSAITLTPVLDTSVILGPIEDRLDDLEDGSSLTAGTVADVISLMAGDGTFITGSNNVATITSPGFATFIDPTGYLGTGTGGVNVNPFDSVDNPGLIPGPFSDKQLAWLPDAFEINGVTTPAGLYRYSLGGAENGTGAQFNWTQVADIGGASGGGGNTPIDLTYVPETYDATGEIVTQINTVRNITARDINGVPTSFVDQFSLPIASEEQFGMVRLSRVVQEAIEECSIEVIEAGGSTVEYSYALSPSGFSEQWRPNYTSDKIYFDLLNNRILNSPSVPAEGDTNLQDSFFLPAGVLTNAIAAARFSISNASVVVDKNTLSTSGPIFRDVGDPLVDGVYFLRPTDGAVNINAVSDGYPVILETWEFVDAENNPIEPTIGVAHQFEHYQGNPVQNTITEDDITEETCIEITAPVIIDQLITGDRIINLGAGGYIQFYYTQPGSGEDSITMQEGNVILASDGEIYIYIGTDDQVVNDQTDVAGMTNFIHLSAGATPSGATNPYYWEQPPTSDTTTEYDIIEGYLIDGNSNHPGIFVYIGDGDTLTEATDLTGNADYVRIDGTGGGGGTSLIDSDTIDSTDIGGGGSSYRPTIRANDPTASGDYLLTSTYDDTGTADVNRHDLAWTSQSVFAKVVRGTQGTAATTWTITHNLNVSPVIVQVYNTSMEQMVPENITIMNNDTVAVSFASTSIDGSWIVTG